jgi:hypothetical protein
MDVMPECFDAEDDVCMMLKFLLVVVDGAKAKTEEKGRLQGLRSRIALN